MDQALNTIDFDYDPVNDVMYCSFGQPVEAISVQCPQDGVFARVHPETRRAVGITIVDFSRRFSQHAGEPVSVSLSPVETGP